MADIDAKAKELAELDVNSTLNLARRLRGLAVDCENTDGWEAPASDVYQAAALILSQAETIAELERVRSNALFELDRLKQTAKTGAAYAADELRGAPTSTFEIYMGHFMEIADAFDTALARAAKEGQDA